MVREGYQWLATRTLEAYEALDGVSEDDREVLKDLRDYLEETRETGKPYLPEDDLYGATVDVLERRLEGKKPTDPGATMGYAESLIKDYFGIQNNIELYRRAGLDPKKVACNLNESGASSGIIISSEGGKDMFFIGYNPQRQASSVIENVALLYLALQPEFHYSHTIHEDLFEIGNFERLMETVADDPELSKRLERTQLASNPVNFLMLPGMREMAIGLGVDQGGLDNFLKENAHKVNYLECVNSGGSHVLMPEIFSKPFDGRGSVPPSLYDYNLLALAHAIMMPRTHPRGIVHGYVGTGLAEHKRNFPEEWEQTSGSTEFRQELSDEHILPELQRIIDNWDDLFDETGHSRR